MLFKEEKAYLAIANDIIQNGSYTRIVLGLELVLSLVVRWILI